MILAFNFDAVGKLLKNVYIHYKVKNQFKELSYFSQSTTINYKISLKHKDHGMKGKKKRSKIFIISPKPLLVIVGYKSESLTVLLITL